jgi:hypothetical protein
VSVAWNFSFVAIYVQAPYDLATCSPKKVVCPVDSISHSHAKHSPKVFPQREKVQPLQASFHPHQTPPRKKYSNRVSVNMNKSLRWRLFHTKYEL